MKRTGREEKNAFNECPQSTFGKNGQDDLREPPKASTSRRGQAETGLDSAEAKPSLAVSPSSPSTGLGNHARVRERQSKSVRAGEVGVARREGLGPPLPLLPISGEPLVQGVGVLSRASAEVSRSLSLGGCRERRFRTGRGWVRGARATCASGCSLGSAVLLVAEQAQRGCGGRPWTPGSRGSPSPTAEWDWSRVSGIRRRRAPEPGSLSPRSLPAPVREPRYGRKIRENPEPSLAAGHPSGFVFFLPGPPGSSVGGGGRDLSLLNLPPHAAPCWRLGLRRYPD